jgi:PAS domain S-box-containing protein
MPVLDTHKPDLWDTLWENAIGGLAILSKDGTFERANPAFCNIVEYSEYELQRMRFHDITHPTDVAAQVELSAQLASGKRHAFDMVKSYVTKTRKIVWVHLRVTSFEVDGQFHYFLSQVFEIPFSLVNQLSNESSVARKILMPFPWKLFKEWLPWVAFVGAMVFAGIGVVAPMFGGMPPIP